MSAGFYFLACSTNLLTGLYILLALIPFYVFKWSQIILESTGQIFTIFVTKL